MKKLYGKIAFLLVVLLLSCATGCRSNNKNPANIISSSRYIGQARGFFVRTGEGGDFPAPSSVAADGQQNDIKEMVALASANNLNTIFFEARPGASVFYKSKYFPTDSSVASTEKGAIDPLELLCAEAVTNKVQVFAVIDPFSMAGELLVGVKNPFDGMATSGDNLAPSGEALIKLTANSAAELAKSYDISGVVLRGLDASFIQGADVTASVDALVRAVSKAVKKAQPGAAVAIAFDAGNEHNAMTVEAAERLAQEGVVSMVIPCIDSSVDSTGANGYLQVLDRWAAASLGAADLYTLNTNHDDNKYELHNQLLANAMSGKVSGAILAPYSFLKASDRKQNEFLVSLLSAGRSQPVLNPLSFPQTLAVTYPADGAVVYDSSIYLMGTSDPAQPLTIGGKEVPRIGKAGAFGISIDLAVGDNTITVEQGDKKASVKVTRGSAPTGAAPITKITTGSLYPLTPLGVDSNEALEISCVGPAGASITATIGGHTVVMSQSTATKTSGIPTAFKGSITLSPSEFPADKVTNAGNITYVVTYNDSHEVQKSAGEVFVAGKDIPLMLEINEGIYVASVLTDLSGDDNFTQSLKSGGRARVAGKTKTTRDGNTVIAYKLTGGGYLLGDDVKIVEDSTKCQSVITEVIKTEGEGWEQYDFKGGQPAVLADLTDDKLKLQFLDTALTADPLETLTGGIVEKAEMSDPTKSTIITLTFPPDTLWGYDITHSEESTRLFLRKTPKHSEIFGKPLDGIKILLDPGHGGTDPGAMGVAGITGPSEAVLNLAVANAARFRLEQLGAEVTMTRTSDEGDKISLDARNFQAEKEHPHLFISIHHNSTALVKDLTDVHHMEAYYWETAGKPLAEGMMQSLAATTGRDTKEPENAHYYVTRLTFAPAVLFEMGFVVNPAQYEDSCGTPSRYKAANGIAMAVVDILG